MKSSSVQLALGVFGIVLSVSAWAAAPPCMGGGHELPVDDQAVLSLKKSSPLGLSVRAHVAGRVSRVFSDQTHHAHFEILIGDSPKDTLEVIYSEGFGDLPNPSLGAQVETCGDFINSYAPFNGYPISPSGAIIHWVHRSDSANHESGYVMLDNVVYGQKAESGSNGKP